MFKFKDRMFKNLIHKEDLLMLKVRDRRVDLVLQLSTINRTLAKESKKMRMAALVSYWICLIVFV